MRKNRILLSLAIVIAFLSLTAIAAADPYVCGDSDSSGAVDIDDVVYLLAYIFQGGPAPQPLPAGDADCSGEIDIDDVVYLIAYIFQGGPAPCTVTDIDGNVYQTIKIGDQCWMAENLKVTHYRNGDSIPNVTDNGEWENQTDGAYCEYDNDPANVETYGCLYNWYAVDDPRDIAPEGWHVPTDDEWKELEMYLGMSQAEADATDWRGTDEGGKLKEADTTHWQNPNTGATNESGFTALPGGYRYYLGDFRVRLTEAYFWSNTEFNSDYVWGRTLNNNQSQVYRHYHLGKNGGFSVRCVRD